MRRVDLIAFEAFVAEVYRRESINRKGRNPALAARLAEWGEASKCRAEEMRCGPLFGAEEKP